jgi:hypothetical protein
MSATICIKGQTPEYQYTYTATIGTGISMNQPAYTPLTVQFLGHYPVSKRFSAGIGTGLSFYEQMLIPVFSDAKFAITSPRKFTPFVECGIGYAFAPTNKAHGGFFLHPSIGVQYALTAKIKLQFAAGYELQNLKRLKAYSNDYLTVEFAEKLAHQTISIRVGVLF